MLQRGSIQDVPLDGERGLGLMLRTEEVVHCLHGIECFEWNLDEDGVPIAHGAVPKAGEFKG